MKKLLAAALGAAAVTASLLGAGTASADNYQDAQFLGLLEGSGIQANMLGIPFAHAACANIDAYRYSSGLWPATRYAINQVAAASPTLYGDLPMQFVSASVVIYCPWNLLSGNANQDFLA